MKKLGLAVTLALAPVAAWAQEMPIAAVNTTDAVLKSEAGKVAQTKLTARIDEITKQLDTKRKEIDELKARLDKREGLTDQAVTELRDKITQQQRALDRAAQDADNEMDDLRQEVLGPIVKVTRAELEKLVKEKGYIMVVDLAPDPSRFPFVHEKILITDELVKRINAAMKATPVDAKTPPPAATKTTSP